MRSANGSLSDGPIDVAGFAGYLDALDDDERVRRVRSLSRREQALLFDAVEGVVSIGLADLVPPGTDPLGEVIHYGRNSLPVARIFEKRFCRAPDRDDELWGYNEHAFRWATGPGYFVVRDRPGGEALIDYTEVPSGKPAGWPPIKSNSSLRGRFVYGGTQDILRGVARGVHIGRATRDGKTLDNWFVLCRRLGSDNETHS